MGAGCASPSDRILGAWHGSAFIKRPPSGNPQLDKRLNDLKTKVDYKLTLKRGGLYDETVGKHEINGSWTLAGQVLTLTPTKYDGGDPAKARSDMEQLNNRLQISLPLPEGTDGPRAATVSSDYQTITMPSIGVNVDLKR